MEQKNLVLYAARWNDRDLAYALTIDAARKAAEGHYAFGDPAVETYALGNQWAQGSDDPGWRICAVEVTAPEIPVQLQTGDNGETAHVAWQCPFCLRDYSDDWCDGDTFPILLRCGCEERSQFLLGVGPRQGIA